MARVIITMSEGLISGVYTDVKGLEVDTIDYDEFEDEVDKEEEDRVKKLEADMKKLEDVY